MIGDLGLFAFQDARRLQRCAANANSGNDFPSYRQMKALLLTGASAVAIVAGAHWLTRPRAAGWKPTPTRADPPERIVEAARRFLMYVVLPVWIGAGLADWACHRASNIEHTGGPEETLLHLLMLAEMGAPSLAALLLEVNSPVFALMIAMFLLHEVTALWDIRYAASSREVSPLEQHVHDFLGAMPLAALGLNAVLHPGQFGALFGLGDESRDLRLRPKREPLPAPYVAGVLAAIAAFNLLPYLEELWRGLRARAEATTVRPGSLTTRTVGNSREAISVGRTSYRPEMCVR